MRTAATYLTVIGLLLAATLLFHMLFNVWQFGICRTISRTSGTLADKAFPGWKHGVHSRHTRQWFSGQGWMLE